MAVDLSIIICTYNRYDLLPEAIASVELQELSQDRFELLVVDNSTDELARARFLPSLDIECRHQILELDSPGLSRARNCGVEAARGRIVAFMDDDARASPGWATEILASFERFPRAGIVGGPVRAIWTKPRPPWLHAWLEGYLTILDRGAEERVLNSDEWLAGTNIAFLREPLKEAGGFEERLGRIGRLLLSNEELATTRAIGANGYSAIYNPRAEMRHIVHAERLHPSWIRQRIFWQSVSDMLSGVGDDRDFHSQIARILDYQSKLRPRDRGLAGLFQDVDDPLLFHEQMQALATLLRLCATDGRDWRGFLSADGR